MLTITWAPSITALVWLLVLTLALLALWGRIRTLAEDYRYMAGQLERIAEHVAGIRHELGGLARAQQVDELRRTITTDLRPIIADAVALETANRRRAPGKRVGIAFEGQATVTGAVVGGDAGAVKQGGSDESGSER